MRQISPILYWQLLIGNWASVISTTSISFEQSDPSMMKPVQCYSCMSKSYNNFWKGGLDQVYREPKDFDDRCNEPFHGRGSIHLVNCTSVCVTIKQREYNAGIFIGERFIRGCLDSILKSGFNDTAIKTHRFRQQNICRYLPRTQLFAPAPIKEGEVYMCSCYADRCNAASQRFKATHLLSSVLALWTLFHPQRLRTPPS